MHQEDIVRIAKWREGATKIGSHPDQGYWKNFRQLVFLGYPQI
ncbi:hypothetical protein AAULR_22834 [Lacticaseibacillus rhamnosus MTCC 5462]|nr:hypothetical protein AAULR_22834 [Lacticaseibacillus rhamnosus MTCC 5462]